MTHFICAQQWPVVPYAGGFLPVWPPLQSMRLLLLCELLGRDKNCFMFLKTVCLSKEPTACCCIHSFLIFSWVFSVRGKSTESSQGKTLLSQLNLELEICISNILSKSAIPIHNKEKSDPDQQYPICCFGSTFSYC